MDIIIDVSQEDYNVTFARTNSKAVHAEPGDDKVRYAKDVVDWVMARLN